MTDYISNIKKNFSLSNILMTFFIVFLPIFSFGIFGPTEIFFANHTTFGVVFNEFGLKFLAWGTLIALISALLSLLLPKLLHKILLSILSIFSLCGYVQTMFLNKGLDQIGATTDGYIPTQETLIKNGLIWFALIIAMIVVVIKSKENWKKPLFYVSLVLIAMQGVAYGTLFLTSPETAFKYVESEVQLTGEKQYTVSSEENVIIFILDTLSNTMFESTLSVYPELADTLTDFTYYNNTNCDYYGTFPSVPHLLTGNAFDPTQPVNSWLYDCWHNESTTKFYNDLHAAGYQVNLYVTEPTLLTGSKPLSDLDGYVDNLDSLTHNISIDYPLLYETLLTMSCYRFMPDYFKPSFDVPNTQYASIVSYPDNTINYANPEFYADLCEKGLTADDSSKYFIVQHLNGIHECINNEYCERVNEEDSNYDATIRGIWVMLAEYLNLLMDCDAYDNSTIIITSDHGSEYFGQSIFFIKEPHTKQTEMQITNAPISLDELLPTVAQITLGESEYLGKTIYDFKPDEMRERSLYIRNHSNDYPKVNKFDGLSTSDHNVYHVYTYTGNYFDYAHQYDNELYTVVPTVEAYY